MMEIYDALYTYLTGYAGLSALVGTRLYPDILPQNCVLPAVTYQQIGEDEIQTFNTPASNMITPIFQFITWAATRAAAFAVSKQIRLAFKNHSGVTGGEGGVTINAILPENRLIEYDDERKEWQVIQEFEISYQE